MELVTRNAPGLVDVFAADDLVASLFWCGPPPRDLDYRVEAALAWVRPFLAPMEATWSCSVSMLTAGR